MSVTTAITHTHMNSKYVSLEERRVFRELQSNYSDASDVLKMVSYLQSDENIRHCMFYEFLIGNMAKIAA